MDPVFLLIINNKNVQLERKEIQSNILTTVSHYLLTSYSMFTY